MIDNYFSNDYHRIAYCINRNELIKHLRDQLNENGKKLSIGEIDKKIYITVLYEGNMIKMTIPDNFAKSIKIHNIYCIIHNSFISDNSDYD